MSDYSDLEDMIEVLTIAIAREESEERFFRRSAEGSKHETARKMFSETAEEFASVRKAWNQGERESTGSSERAKNSQRIVQCPEGGMPWNHCRLRHYLPCHMLCF
jgi:hypothetical protein